MNPSDLITFLRDYNRWRQGEVPDQPSPASITAALEAACAAIEQLEAWREVARMLAASLQAGAGAFHPSAYHYKGTALESYERMRSTGTPSEL
jgi:hypothetical protein